MKTVRIQKKCYKNKTRQVKNAFDGQISRLDMAEERISDQEDRSIETCKTERQ